MALDRAESEPRKQAAPITQIALDGISIFESDGVVKGTGFCFNTKKSAKKSTKKSAAAVLRDPLRKSQNTPSRVGALMINAIRSLVCAASVFVIGVPRGPVPARVGQPQS